MSRQPVDLDELRAGRFHDRLVALAGGLFEDAGHDPADWCTVIVVSGLACDAAASYALRCFLEADSRRSKPHLGNGQARKVREVLRSKKTVNLKPRSQRASWEALSDDRITRWPDWIRYVRCVDRRNSVLREGLLPSRRRPARADAVEAVEVMRSLCAHLARVLNDEPLLRDRA
ncbi:MAG: hypothetical protein QOF59_2420 [Actinomycetota bacterium]|nr:hypothetical protein [Actinomycetota bacterium]